MTRNKLRMLLILTLIMVFLPAYAILGKSEPSNLNNTYYQYVQIETGDTLWSIACSYAKEGQDINQYIREIKNFNKLRTNVLRAGDCVIVPVNY